MPAALPDDIGRAAERRAWELRHVYRWPVRRIAEDLGVTPGTVSKMVGRCDRELAERFGQMAFRLKCRQTAVLHRILEEALEAWEASKGDAVTVTSGRAELDRAGRVVALPDEVRTTGQRGAPQFLAQARAALADIRAIWGLDAPKSVDVTSQGEPIKLYAGVDVDAV